MGLSVIERDTATQKNICLPAIEKKKKVQQQRSKKVKLRAAEAKVAPEKLKRKDK